MYLVTVNNPSGEGRMTYTKKADLNSANGVADAINNINSWADAKVEEVK
jgi:hypothetical protein